jgi:hypothetical protein
VDDWGFESRQKLGIFLFIIASRPALGPTQPPVQWVPGALSLGIKRPECETDHSPPPSAEVKEYAELYLHSSSTPSWRGAQLKTQGKLYPYLLHDDRGSGVRFPAGAGNFLFTTVSRTALGPTPEALSLG